MGLMMHPSSVIRTIRPMLNKSDCAPLSEEFTPAALFRLMTWLSPGYPIGAFSYSSGIEWAVESGDILNSKTLKRWLETIIVMGAGFCDAVFFAHAHRAAAARDYRLLAEIASLASAFAPSKERFAETTAQGEAFLVTTRAAWPCATLERFVKFWDGPIVLPVGVGVACAGHDIPLAPALHCYLQSLAANLISAGTRLIPLGQTDAQRVMAVLEPTIAATAERALGAALDDIGTSTFRADLASMHHETQYTRLFRS
jgi:urease accessory protein